MGYRFDILLTPMNRTDPFPQYLRRLIALRQQRLLPTPAQTALLSGRPAPTRRPVWT